MKLAVNQNGRWAPHLAYIREAVRAGLIGEVTGAHVEIRWNHGWIAGTAFDAVDDLILWDFGIHWFDFLASVIGARALRSGDHGARAGQSVRPPLLAQALVAFDGGQASLVFDGATRAGAHDSTAVIGTRGVAFSQGPDLGRQSVELHTEARRRPAGPDRRLVQRRLRRNHGRTALGDRGTARAFELGPRQPQLDPPLPGGGAVGAQRRAT